MYRHLRPAAVFVLCLLAGAVSAGPKEDITARHRALITAFNSGKVSAIRPFYAPGYVAHGPQGRLTLEQSMKVTEQIFKAGVKVRVTASLSRIVVKGNTATARESATILLTGPNGQQQTVKGVSDQRWKKFGSLWKLVWEKTVS